MGIMFGSTGKKRKHRKITLWIHKHIQVIAMVPAVIGRIPSDVAVRPWKIAVAITVGNAFFFTVTDAFFPFSVWSNNGIPSPAIARECGCIRSFEKEKLRKRLLRKRVFSKMQLRGFCVYLQRNSRINGIARLEKMDVSYQAENASEWEFDSPALLRLIQDKTVLVIVQEYSCFYVLPIVV